MPGIHLKIVPKGEKPLSLELGKGDFLIGREEGSDVLIDNDGISRRHALLSIRDDGVYVKDLGSSNGTFVNNKLADSEMLFKPGQQLDLGGGAIVIEFAEPKVESGQAGKTVEPKVESSGADKTAEAKVEPGEAEKTAEPKIEPGKAGKTAEPKVESGEASKTIEAKVESGEAAKTVEAKVESGEAAKTVEPKAESGEAAKTAEPKAESGEAAKTAKPKVESSRPDKTTEAKVESVEAVLIAEPTSELVEAVLIAESKSDPAKAVPVAELETDYGQTGVSTKPKIELGGAGKTVEPNIEAGEDGIGAEPNIELSGLAMVSDPEPGSELNLSLSNYALRGEIARGDTGTVFEAEDLNTGRLVAIKQMLDDLEEDEEGQFLFQQEARIMGFLEHSNIVPMHELGVTEKGIPYYTMKRIVGVSLHQVLDGIKERDEDMIRDFPLTRLLHVFQQVCDGIAFAHSKGVLHRDLKPENVLIGEYGEVMVMDWGLATVMPGSPLENTVIGRTRDILDAGEVSILGWGTVTQTGPVRNRAGQVLGTPNYMPPEQAEGRLEDVDTRADIFSLGGILYSILTLRPPVTGDTVEEVLESMREGYIAPAVIYNKVTDARLPGMGERDEDEGEKVLLRHCPGELIPLPLSKVAMKAMALKPGKRYSSVRDLQVEVEAWETGRVTEAEGASLSRKVKLFVGRNVGTTITAVLVLCLALGVFLRISVFEQDKTEAQNRARELMPVVEKGVQEQIKAGEFERAKRRLESWANILPEESRYHLLSGDVNQMLFSFADAVTAYHRAGQTGADAEQVKESIAICRELNGMMEGNSLSEEGAQKLLEHLNSRWRFAEARWLATRYEVKAGITDAEFTEILEHLRQIEVAEDLVSRLRVDKERRLVLDLKGTDVDSIDWVENLPLDVVDLTGTKVTDLRPLKGTPLQSVMLSGTPVIDLEPLRSEALTHLQLSSTLVSDLSALVGMPALTNLDISLTDVTDLEPLRGLTKMRLLQMKEIGAADLGPLVDMNLNSLNIMGCAAITSIEALRGMELEWLTMSFTGVVDLEPLADSRLRHVRMSGIPATDFGVLRGKKLSSGWFNETELDDLDVFRNMALVELHLASIPARDFSVLQALPLDRLTLTGTSIEDLSPLSTQGKLDYLDLSFTRIRSLAPLGRVAVNTLLLHGCDGIEDWYKLPRISGVQRLSFSDGAFKSRLLTGCRSLQLWAGLKEKETAAVKDTVWRTLSSQQQFWKDYGKRKGER